MEDPTQHARDQMVESIARRGVLNPEVLAAMRRFPRHELVPESLRSLAYADRPVPIGQGQTISQPYMVAFMSAAASVQPGEKVLEVGTGSGYQTAILALLGARVYSVEILDDLARAARAALDRLHIPNVLIKTGDGYQGWPEHAPFAAIVVTAAAPRIPPPLLEQLAEGGRLVIPVGPQEACQRLEIHERRQGRIRIHPAFPVRFVPMTGEVTEEPGPYLH